MFAFIFLRILTNKAIEANDGKPLPLYQKALCGLTAGAIGASVGSPADLALIRMQADATLPEAQRRHYKNAFHALSRIVSDEGVLALWKGAGPTVVRAMALNMGMLASYDQSVELFKDSLGFGEGATVVGKILCEKYRYWLMLKSLVLLFGVSLAA
jgi:solute carrier family 25 oxoglutarate transporter 11